MHTKRNLAGTMAVLTALMMTVHSPADAQRRGDRGDRGSRGGVTPHGGNFGGQMRGADLARARVGGSSAMRRMSRDSGRNFVSSSAHSGSRPSYIPTSTPPGFSSSRYASSNRSWDRDRRGRNDWDRGSHRSYSRHYDHDWDRKRYRRYDRDYDNDSYYISIGLGGGYPSYSSYYSYPYYNAPYYGYGYTSPYAYYGYPYSPYSGYAHYTGYSSYYGGGGYYW